MVDKEEVVDIYLKSAHNNMEDIHIEMEHMIEHFFASNSQLALLLMLKQFS